MNAEEGIVNRVANSPLITLDLEEFYDKGDRVLYDLKDNLFEGLILKERDFRSFVKEHDWSQYEGKNIAVTCTVDAIVPIWAYMLLTTKLSPYANMVVKGSLEDLDIVLFKEALSKVDVEEYRNKKVVIKGCGNLPVPDFAYVELSRLMTPVVSSLMFGEPCSTVPLYKKKVNK
ncbi:MAG: DUF2480 family protein [Bacteroidota bacterium]